MKMIGRVLPSKRGLGLKLRGHQKRKQDWKKSEALR